MHALENSAEKATYDGFTRSKEPMKIFRQDLFINEEGIKIFGFTRVDLGVMTLGENDTLDVPPFQAQAALEFDAGNGQRGEFPFTFTIPGKCIDEAYVNFPEALEEARPKAEAALHDARREAQHAYLQQLLGSGSFPTPTRAERNRRRIG